MAYRTSIGRHIRGTDKRAVGKRCVLQKVIPPRKYRPLIARFLAAHPDARVFVATDQVQLLEEIPQDRTLSTDSLRSSGQGRGSNVFEQSGDGFRKGAEVLIDALLVSRCDSLAKC